MIRFERVDKAVPWESDEPFSIIDIMREIIFEKLRGCRLFSVDWIEDIPLLIISEKNRNTMPLHSIRTSWYMSVDIKDSLHQICFSFIQCFYKKFFVSKRGKGMIKSAISYKIICISLSNSRIRHAESCEERYDIFSGYK